MRCSRLVSQEERRGGEEANDDVYSRGSKQEEVTRWGWQCCRNGWLAGPSCSQGLVQVTGEALGWLQRVLGSAESDGCCAHSFELSGTSVTTQAAGGGQGNVGGCSQVGVTKNTGNEWAVPSLLDFLGVCPGACPEEGLQPGPQQCRAPDPVPGLNTVGTAGAVQVNDAVGTSSLGAVSGCAAATPPPVCQACCPSSVHQKYPVLLCLAPAYPDAVPCWQHRRCWLACAAWLQTWRVRAVPAEKQKNKSMAFAVQATL